MSRLVTAGWETGIIAELGSINTNIGTNGSISVATSPVNPGGSTRALQINGSGGDARQVKWSFTAVTELFLRASIEVSAAGNSADVACLAFFQGTNVQLIVTINPNSGVIKVWNCTTGTTVNLLGTASGAISTGAYHLIQVHAVASTTVGSVVITVDGVQTLSVSSVNTAPQGTNNYDGFACCFGIENNGSNITALGYGSFGAPNYLFDDVALNNNAGTLNNGLPANAAVLYQKLAADSTPLNWTPSSAGTHFSLLDAQPANQTTNFVSTAVASTEDEYTITSLPTNASAVPVVIPVAFAAVPSGAGGVQLRNISGVTTTTGASHTLTSTPTQYEDQYETDPNTTAAWTVANVNALKLGLISA